MKKGMMIQELVGIILIMVLFMVLLQVFGVYQWFLNLFGQDLVCQGSFLASSMSSKFSLTGSKIDPRCKTNRIVVVEEPQFETQTETGELIYALDTQYVSTLPHPGISTYDYIYGDNGWNDEHPGYAYTYYEEEKDQAIGQEEIVTRVTMRYNMDKIIADELKRCWDITNKGNLPIFDHYWNYIGCYDESGDIVRECEHDTFWDLFKNLSEYQSRNYASFCVLCSRIKFDPKIQTMFDASYVSGQYNSLHLWLGNHPYQVGSKMSYYEYMLDTSQKEFEGLRATEEDLSYTTAKPYAVVFVRVNFHAIPYFMQWSVRIADSVLDYLPMYEGTENWPVRYVNTLMFIPYDEIPNNCNYIVGSYV